MDCNCTKYYFLLWNTVNISGQRRLSWNICPIADTINVSAAKPCNFSNDHRIKKSAIELLSLFIKLMVYPETCLTTVTRWILALGM